MNPQQHWTGRENSAQGFSGWMTVMGIFRVNARAGLAPLTEQI